MKKGKKQNVYFWPVIALVTMGIIVYIVAHKVLSSSATTASGGNGKAPAPGGASAGNSAAQPTTPGKVLQQQSSPVYDEDVANLQQYLNDYGAYALQTGQPTVAPLTIDGKFGPLTTAALKFYLNKTSITVAELGKQQADLLIATSI